MNARFFFPLGKAYNAAFCNRLEETKKLIGHIDSGKHVFLVAPRRYGKSSLCEHVFAISNWPVEKLDFHIAVTEKDAERIILNGVTSSIGNTIGSVDKLAHIIKKLTKKLHPKFIIGAKNLFSLELEAASESNPAENIVDALMLLEKLLGEKRKKAVFLLDEFQEIGEIGKGRGIEGAIRHVAQETKNLTFIFSGSNPHILASMFEDERRPLYKLCRKLVLNRIDSGDYQKHLNKAAKAQWKHELPNEVFEQIINLSERHPYYLNYLCDEIWSICDKPPKIADVNFAWNCVVEEERSDLLKDFFSLSDNQRKLLIYIANCGTKDLFSKEATKKMDVHTTSIPSALNILLEKDYLEKTAEGYRLIVPVYKNLLSKSNF